MLGSGPIAVGEIGDALFLALFVLALGSFVKYFRVVAYYKAKVEEAAAQTDGYFDPIADFERVARKRWALQIGVVVSIGFSYFACYRASNAKGVVQLHLIMPALFISAVALAMGYCWLINLFDLGRLAGTITPTSTAIRIAVELTPIVLALLTALLAGYVLPQDPAISPQPNNVKWQAAYLAVALVPVLLARPIERWWRIRAGEDDTVKEANEVVGQGHPSKGRWLATSYHATRSHGYLWPAIVPPLWCVVFLVLSVRPVVEHTKHGTLIPAMSPVEAMWWLGITSFSIALAQLIVSVDFFDAVRPTMKVKVERPLPRLSRFRIR